MTLAKLDQVPIAMRHRPRIAPSLASLAAVLLVPAAAIGQAAPPASGDGDIEAVTCVDRTLTICENKYCSFSFDRRGHDAYRFDFTHGTYDAPALKIAGAPMKDLAIERAGTTFIARFRIELAKPVYVQFVKNVPQGIDGPTGERPQMTAARTLTYPPTRDRAPIDVISGMQCDLTGGR